jgi:Ca2+-binding EF-hand superfamily protein
LQQSLFSNADTNDDGDLSLSEFESIGQNVQGSGNTPPSGSTNPSSLLTTAALTALLAQQQQSQQSGQTIGSTQGGTSLQNVFAAADTNGDGSVSTDELNAYMTANAPQGATVTPTDGSDTSATQSATAATKPHHHHGGHHGPPPGVGSAESTDPTSTTAANSNSSSGSSSQVFDPADTNKDGVVSADELASVLGSAIANAGSSISSDAMANMTKLLDQLSSNSSNGSSSNGSSSTTSIAA